MSKIFAIWNIKDPAVMLKQVVANAYGADPKLQLYCLGLLAEPKGTFTGSTSPKSFRKKWGCRISGRFTPHPA